MEIKLAEVKVDMKKVVTHIIGRLIFAIIVIGVIVVGSYVSTGEKEYFWLATIVLIVIGLLYTIYPLRYKDDVLEFYNGKIICDNKVLSFNEPNYRETFCKMLSLWRRYS